MMDLRSKKIRSLSRKSRYLSAAISPDGKNIAATENTTDNKNSLVFIDAETGNVLKAFPLPGMPIFSSPQWSEGGEKVTVISLTADGEGILSYSIYQPMNGRRLLSEGKNDLQSSFLRNDSLFFVSSVSGTDNIYLLTPDRKINRYYQFQIRSCRSLHE